MAATDMTTMTSGMTLIPTTSMPMPAGNSSSMGMQASSPSRHANAMLSCWNSRATRWMYFYFGDSMVLLFSTWNIATPQGLVGSIFAMLFLAVFYEGLKSLREYLMHVAFKSLSTPCCCADTKPIPDLGWRSIFQQKFKLPLLIHVFQSILHVIQIGVAYLLMLAVMTFNGWIFLFIVFGAGVGYLIFGWTKFLYGNGSTQDCNDCCV